MLAIVGFCALNFLVSFFRYAVSFTIFRFSIPARSLYRSFVAGQVGALSFGGPFAQGLARQALLPAVGVSPSIIAVLGLAERAIALLTLLALAIVAAFSYFPEMAGSIDLRMQEIDASLYLGAMALVVIAFVFLAPLRAQTSWREIFKTISVLGATRSIALSFVSHLAMLGAFACSLLAWGGKLGMEEVAALAIVMLVSSLPISFSGWGVREAASAFMLAKLGYPEATGVAVGLTVGLCSLVPLLLAAGLNVARRTAPKVEPHAPGRHLDLIHLDRSLVVGMAAAIGCLVFFQVRLSVGLHMTNLNAADLLATISVVIVAAELYMRRSERSALRSSAWTRALLIFSALIAFGSVVAILQGATTWGLLNRGLGWMLILSYATVGLCIAIVGRPQDISSALLSVVFANALVTLVQIAANLGALVPGASNSLWLIGWHALTLDPNAYCLQCALSLAGWYTLLAQGARIPNDGWRGKLFWLAPVILGTGMILTMSRIGLIFFLVVSGTSLALPRSRKRTIINVVASSACGFALPPTLKIMVLLTQTYGVEAVSLGIRLGDKNSDGERLQTIADGLKLWLEHPLIGSGLGGYMEQRLANGLPPQVIHNIYVWLLAETGLVGLALALAAFAVFALGIFRVYRRAGLSGAVYGAAVGLLLFLMGGMVHDFFYQRSLWLMLGLFAAMLGRSRLRVAQNEPGDETLALAPAQEAAADARALPFALSGPIGPSSPERRSAAVAMGDERRSSLVN